MVLLTAREFDRADHHSERSLALNPNDGDAAAYRAYILSFLGRPDEAVPLIQRAIALNPYHPACYWTVLARALQGAGNHAEAVVALGRIERPRYHHHARLAACHNRLRRRRGQMFRGSGYGCQTRLFQRGLGGKPAVS